MRLVAACLLAIAAGPVSGRDAPATMTLAEARRLSPQQLAERLLGMAGANGKYVEAEVQGDGGYMVHVPGLNFVELYRRPQSAGFAGLCKVESVGVSFTTSRFDAPGDPPHGVVSFYTLTRYAIRDASQSEKQDADWRSEDRDCGRLSPVAHRIDPMFFAVDTGLGSDAAFVMRTLAAVKSNAARLGPALHCRAEGGDAAVCRDPVTTLQGFPEGRISAAEVQPCASGVGRCVNIECHRVQEGKDYRVVRLEIATALQLDRKATPQITDINILAGLVIVD